MEGKFSILVDDGVSGVAAPLVADHKVIVLGEQIHHPSLALVPPVDAHDGAV